MTWWLYRCQVISRHYIFRTLYGSIYIYIYIYICMYHILSKYPRLLEGIPQKIPRLKNNRLGLLVPDTKNCGFGIRWECRNVFPATDVSDSGMHYSTCVTHVPWCMSGSQTRGGGENGIPGACATRYFTYLVRGLWHKGTQYMFKNYLVSLFPICFVHIGLQPMNRIQMF